MVSIGGVSLKTPRVVGVIIEGRVNAAAKKAVDAGADFLELRADTFKNISLEKIEKALNSLRAFKKPVILTIRSKKEGGKCLISEKKRASLFDALMPLADAVDIELGSSAILKNVVNSAKGHKKKVIVSYHNFKTTPGEKKLLEIAAGCHASGADIVKVATFARGPEDLRLLARFLTDFNDLTVIAMGAHGAGSRVFFPLLGSMLTYGSVTGPSAPGQMPVAELTRELRRYGLGGRAV